MSQTDKIGQIESESFKKLKIRELWKLLDYENVSKQTIITIAVLDSNADFRHDHEDKPTDIESIKIGPRNNTNGDHGSQVIGIIAAPNNNAGILGIAYKSKILHIQLPMITQENKSSNLTHKNKTVDDLYTEALECAINKKVDIINLSFGWPQSYIHEVPKFKAKLEEARKQNIIVVAAAGNRGNDWYSYLFDWEINFPASHSSVIGVGSIENDFSTLSTYSRSGPEMFLVPGSWKTTTNESYTDTIGTSFSSACVSGLIAIILAYRRSRGHVDSVEDIKWLLKNSCEKLGDGIKNNLFLHFPDYFIIIIIFVKKLKHLETGGFKLTFWELVQLIGLLPIVKVHFQRHMLQRLILHFSTF